MPRYFTQYWRKDTCEESARYCGQLLDYIAGNLFRKHGVKKGDLVYVVTVKQGRLFLIGRIKVGRICGSLEAERLMDAEDLWPANEHVFAESGTPMHFHIEVPCKVTEKLLFVSSPHSKLLCFVTPGHLDKQTLRGVREIEPASAKALDRFLSADRPVPKD